MQSAKPKILVLNDDQHLLETRRMLFEAFGAEVVTGRGTRESIHQILVEPADLVLIDASNVGMRHGEFLCETIKQHNPSQTVALLIRAEMRMPEESRADRIIQRLDPKHILHEVNQLLQNRLALKV